ncbi:MAG: hypothetical protein WBC04_08405 [Candidatus Acidiferrales bacterium]
MTAELIATQLIETKGEAYRKRSIHEIKPNLTQLIENKQPRSLQIDTKRNVSDEKVNTTVFVPPAPRLVEGSRARNLITVFVFFCSLQETTVAKCQLLENTPRISFLAATELHVSEVR